MHCIVKKTLQWVVEHDNHYVVAVKGNQGRLKRYLEQVQATQQPQTKTLERDCSHGRRVERCTRVYPVPEVVTQEWPQAMSMIVIERSGQREGQVFKTFNYYLSDLALEAKAAAQLVREHWDIENGFHWVRDVVFNEDDSLITQRSPALNWALFRSMAINLFRAAGLMSLTRAIRLFGHDIPALFSLLTTN
jgi:predicted transposase YbfD/YdcC